jgi:hypothetical protein
VAAPYTHSVMSGLLLTAAPAPRRTGGTGAGRRRLGRPSGA